MHCPALFTTKTDVIPTEMTIVNMLGKSVAVGRWELFPKDHEQSVECFLQTIPSCSQTAALC